MAASLKASLKSVFDTMDKDKTNDPRSPTPSGLYSGKAPNRKLKPRKIAETPSKSEKQWNNSSETVLGSTLKDLGENQTDRPRSLAHIYTATDRTQEVKPLVLGDSELSQRFKKLRKPPSQNALKFVREVKNETYGPPISRRSLLSDNLDRNEEVKKERKKYKIPEEVCRFMEWEREMLLRKTKKEKEQLERHLHLEKQKNDVEMHKLKQDHKREIKLKRDEMDSRRYEYKSEIEAIRDMYQREMKAYRHEHQREMETHEHGRRNEIKTLQDIHQREMRDYREHHERRREAKCDSMMEDFCKEREDLDERFKALRAEKQHEKELLVKSHQDERDKMLEVFRAQSTRLEANLDTLYVQAQHEKELLIKSHQEECDRMAEYFRTESEQLRENFEALRTREKMEDEARFKHQLEARSEESGVEIKQLQAILAKKDTRFERHCQEKEAVEAIAGERRSELDRLRGDLARETVKGEEQRQHLATKDEIIESQAWELTETASARELKLRAELETERRKREEHRGDLVRTKHRMKLLERQMNDVRERLKAIYGYKSLLSSVKNILGDVLDDLKKAWVDMGVGRETVDDIEDELLMKHGANKLIVLLYACNNLSQTLHEMPEEYTKIGEKFVVPRLNEPCQKTDGDIIDS